MAVRAAIYVRISRDRVGAGLGVGRQEQDCRELAAKLGWKVIRVHADNDMSAYSGKPRPSYLEMLADIGAGLVDAVIAWHTDRLHRSPTELETYISTCDLRGVPTHTVKAGPIDLATPSGRLVARQLGAVARYEVEHMIERQKRAKLQVATEGRWKGGPRPFGYEPDGMTPRMVEAKELLDASIAVLRGASLRGHACDLNARGFTTSTGAPWTSTALLRVLTRPRNAGLMEHQEEIIGKAAWPAVVPEDIWRGVVAVLSDPSRRTQLSSARRWLGSGLYMCHCGATVRVHVSGGKRPGAHPAYTCSITKHLTRIAFQVDDLVHRAVIKRLSRADAVDLMATEVNDTSAETANRAAVARARLDELALLYANGELSASQLSTATGVLREQLRELESRLAEVSRGSELAGLVGVPDVAAAWEAVNLDRKRAVIDTLMTVTLLPSRKGRPPGWRPGESYFDRDTVSIYWKRPKSKI